jgi:DNA-binding response OmpR family regulator
VYQAVPEPADDATRPAVRVMLVIEVPGGAAVTEHVAALADDFATKVSRLVPGVRVRRQVTSSRIEANGLTINLADRRVSVDGRSLRLAYQEFALLAYLAASPHQTVSRTTLLQSVWSERPGRETISERTVDTHVRRLRAKLGRHAHVITTVRGHGYRFDPSSEVRVRAGTVRRLA